MWPTVTYTFSPSTTAKSSEVNQNFSDVLGNIEEGTPTGFGGEWFTNTAPTGWLLQDGSAVSRTTYARLFAIIGTTYGVGDGSTTFNLPNKKGKVGVGRDAAQTEFDTLAETGGAKTHTLDISEIPSVASASHTHNVSGTTGIESDKAGSQGYDSGGNEHADKNHTHSFSDTSDGPSSVAGGGGAHNNLQPYLVQNFIIKD